MKKLIILFMITGLLFLSSCGVQWMVAVGANGQVGGGGQYSSQQQPCQQQPYNGYYYSQTGPEPPIITNGGVHRCPEP